MKKFVSAGQHTNKSKINVLFIALSMLLLIPTAVYAEAYFNPAFLSEDTAGVADLSRFEQGQQQPAGVYRADIWRNGEFFESRDLRFIEAKSDVQNSPLSGGLTVCINAELLAALGADMGAISAASKHDVNHCLPLSDTIPGAILKVNFPMLRVDISLPQAAMDHHARGYIPASKWDNGIPALMSNYQFSGDRGSHSRSYYLNLLNGANLGAWRLRNTSAWSTQSGQFGRYSAWQNINTYAQRALIDLRSTLILGQNSTPGDIFDSIAYAGLRIYTADMMYPDSLQGYAPVIRGIAQTSARVIIRQNGYVIDQRYVTPGAFRFDDLTTGASSGDLDVTVEEADGRIQHFSVPYASLPLLQREGRVKYDLVAGRLRSGNTEKASPTFGQLTLLAGLNHGFTLYGGGQFSARYRALMAGTGKNMGRFGALSLGLTATQSQFPDASREQGHALRLLYARSLSGVGTQLQLMGYRYSGRGYYTLDEMAGRSIARNQRDNLQESGSAALHSAYYNQLLSKKDRFQISLSQPLGDYGSLYLSASQQSYWDSNQKESRTQFSYISSWQSLSYSLSWSQNHASGRQSNDRIMAFNLSLPLTIFHKSTQKSRWLQRAWSTSTFSQSKNSGPGWQTGIGGTLPEESNLSYNLTQGQLKKGGANSNLSATWKNRYNSLGIGYSAAKDRQDINWQLAGGILAHGDGVTLSQPLGDTNILIKAPGAAGVGVENQTGIKTDWRGYTVVPYATVYRTNRIVLDSNTLDSHTDLDTNVINVIPTEGAVVRADFRTRIGIRAMFTVLKGGKPVPFGAIVRELQTGLTSMVADEGQTFLSGLPLKGTLLIQWGSRPDQSCTAPFSLPDSSLHHSFSIATAICTASAA